MALKSPREKGIYRMTGSSRSAQIPLDASAGQDFERCADLLVHTLSRQSGVTAVQLDLKENMLKLEYNSALITLDRVHQIANEVGIRLTGQTSPCEIKLGGPYCSECSDSLERQLSVLPGVTSASVTPAGVLSVEYAVPRRSWAGVEQAVVQLGHKVDSHEIGNGTRALSAETLQRLSVALTLPALLAGLLARAAGASPWLEIVCALTAYIAGGAFGLQKGVWSLREGQINVDLLMILAAVGAAIIGNWPEGAVLLFLFSLSNVLQEYAMDRSRHAIRNLLDLRPKTAMVRWNGIEVEVAVEDLQPGEIVIIRPGERIPVDGIVVAGESSVDQSSLTGESIPVDKGSQDIVFAGTINQHGSLEVRVSKHAADSTLAKIVDLVEQAQLQRAPTQRTIDTFEQYYAKAVILAVALFIAIPTAVFEHTFEPTFYRAMVLLVVASPCALVISTPASILSAIANAAKHGILFKGGVYLENAARIDVVAFDKTGTLTTGRPDVTDVLPFQQTSREELLSQAASLEVLSEHPLAQAVVAAAQADGLRLASVSEFQAHPGLGVSGMIESTRISIGSQRFMTEQRFTVPEDLMLTLQEMESAGKTGLLVHNGGWLGLIAVADKVRSDARNAVTALRRVGVKHIVMLTGDNRRVAGAIAKEVGIAEYYAELLPQDKQAVMQQLQERYRITAMVGDGVNDAPALASATIGVAMGAAGTDVALETADVVLMADDLNNLPYMVELSKRARMIVWQNLIFSLSVIAVLILGTFGVFGPILPLPLGVVGHEGSTVIVVFNGLRLLGFRRPRIM